MRFLLLIAIILLTSCSAEKQFARFLKKHPEFVTTKTVYATDTGTIKLPVADTRQIDSLLNLLLADSVVKENLTTDFNLAEKDQIKKALVNSTQKQRIAAAVKVLYKERPCISAGDTLTAIENGITLKLWQTAEGIKWKIKHPTNTTVIKQPEKEDARFFSGWTAIITLSVILLAIVLAWKLL